MKELEKMKKLADDFFKEAEKFIEKQKKETKLEFEDHNFRIDSDGWEKKTEDGQEYLENPEGDVWELINCGELSGEQLFTWNAAIRETKKAGKRMPTDEEFDELLKTEADMTNVVMAGYRHHEGPFYAQGTHAHFWSSTESSGTGAWRRFLSQGYAVAYRNGGYREHGFSVRCLKE